MIESFTPEARRLIVLILVGGPLVLVSYTLVFASSSEMRVALWGGVPEHYRWLYTVSMFAAAAGFFAFTYAFLFAAPASAANPDHDALAIAYALVLFPSAAWLPLTLIYLKLPSDWMWWIVRADLFGVAAGSLLILAYAFQFARALPTAPTIAAVIGALAFAWQTLGLDALAWPASFAR
jgi:hypothetical protein